MRRGGAPQCATRAVLVSGSVRGQQGLGNELMTLALENSTVLEIGNDWARETAVCREADGR